MLPFSPRAALCTAVVVIGFGVAVTSQLSGGLFGLIGFERDGFLTMQGGGARPDEAEQSEIVTAVLVHEARQTGRGPICVELSDEGEALAGERLDVVRLQRAAAGATPDARGQFIDELNRRRNPVRAWLRPAAGTGEAVVLSEDNVRRLRTAETALLGGPPGRPVDITLDMATLPENLRATAAGCPVLSFTAPAVAGEIAFVETKFVRRGQPDEAWLYGVARAESRWTVEAMARL